MALTVHASACFQPDEIDNYVTGVMKAQKVPAIVIGIVKDGKLIRKQAYGKVDLELDVDAKPDDVYEIGSITKQFTAAATLMLVEEGKLKLDDSVTKYVDGCPDTWKPITIRHMLYQISGLKDYAFVPNLGIVAEFDRATFMREMSALPLDFDPGVTWAYSNTNYALLGFVIEKAAGKPYTEFVTDRIFKPAGMDHTFFGDSMTVRPRRAHGYMTYQGQILRAQAGAGSIDSDGSINSTIEDMAKWDAVLRDHKLLKESSYKLMWAPATLNSGRTRPYGTGWFLPDPSMDQEYVGHGGNSSGYSAGFARYRDKGLTVIMLSNLYPVGGEAFCQRIAEIIDPSVKPTVPSEQPDPDATRTGKVKEAILTFASGKQDATVLEPEVLAPMKTQRAAMNPTWTAISKMTALKFAGSTSKGKDTMLTYKVVTPDRVFTAYVLWSSAGKIAQMAVRADPPKAIAP